MSEPMQQALLLPLFEPMPASRKDAGLLPVRRPSLLPTRAQTITARAPLGGIQAKLTVGPPDDEYEREADSVADAVMRMPDPGGPTAALPGPTPRIQRLCADCEDQMQRQALPEDDEEQGMLEAKALPGHTPAVTPSIEARVGALKSGGRPLEAGLRRFFEPRFGRDFGAVRIHTGDRAAATARDVGARAFTVGRHVVFGAHDFAPTTRAGRELLAHELTHVVQQTGPPRPPGRPDAP